MEGALKCDICSENFLCQSNLNHHMPSEHGKPAVLPKKPVQCNVCGMKLKCNSALISHMRTHTGERPFKCTVTDCGKEFALSHNLKKHMIVHTAERPFKCTVTDCKVEFKQQSHLQDHMKYKHSDKRPLECSFPDCLFTAKTFVALISHKKKHNVDRPFACEREGCNFSTKFKGNLQRHLKTHHSSAKTAACSEFDSKTTRRGYFKHYMRHQNSLREDNSKCSHPECVEYLICSHDLDCLQSNQNEESSIQCDQSSLEERFADANMQSDSYRDVKSGQILDFPDLYYSYYTSAAEDLHTLEADNQENIEPNQIQTNPSLSKDEEYSYIPDVRPGRDEKEQEFFHQGFNWQDI